MSALPFSVINKLDNLEGLVQLIETYERLSSVVVDEPLDIEDEMKKKEIYDAFLKNPHLNTIQIGTEQEDKRFSINLSIANWLARALCKVENVNTLLIQHVDFDDKVAGVVSRALRRNRTLQKFQIRNVNDNVNGDACNIVVQAVFGALRFRSSLKVLKIGKCALSEATFAAMTEALQLVHSSLEILAIIGKETLSPQIGANLLNAITRNKTLREVLLGTFAADTGNVMGTAMSCLLSDNSILQSLEVWGPFIYELEPSESEDAIDVTSFAPSLASNQSLKEFGLMCWNIGDRGTQSMCEAAKQNTSLVQLDLYRNNFGVEGLKAIKNLLSHETALTHIGLGCNDINDETISYVCEPLESNDTLESLDIGCNNIGVKGMKAIINTVKMNSSITKVVFRKTRGRSMGTALEDELHYYLELNKGARGLLCANPPLPLRLWPHAFKKADDCRETEGDRTRAPDVLYHLVKAKADLFSCIPVSQKCKPKLKRRRGY